jgi:hypothetical protein
MGSHQVVTCSVITMCLHSSCPFAEINEISDQARTAHSARHGSEIQILLSVVIQNFGVT